MKRYRTARGLPPRTAHNLDKSLSTLKKSLPKINNRNIKKIRTMNKKISLTRRLTTTLKRSRTILKNTATYKTMKAMIRMSQMQMMATQST